MQSSVLSSGRKILQPQDLPKETRVLVQMGLEGEADRGRNTGGSSNSMYPYTNSCLF